MIVLRMVNTLKIEDYIKSAWEGDSELEKFYDKSLKRRTLEGMVKDTSRKILDIMEMDENLSLIGVDDDRKMIGFIVLSEKLSLLYSFGINVKYRNKDMLSAIFNYAALKLKYKFYSVMYEHNTRAIDWLQKCGMVIDPSMKPSSDTTYLKYESCQ